MTLRSFVIPSLIASIALLSACSGSGCGSSCVNDVPAGNDQDSDPQDSCSAACDTGDSDSTPAPGFLNVIATVFGTPVQTNVIIDDKVVGTTGQDIELPDGDYTFTVGDDPLVTSNDGIALTKVADWSADSTWSNSRWIHPPVPVTIVSGETVSLTDLAATTEELTDDALVQNFFIDGVWTCDNGFEISGLDVDYSGGSVVFLQTVGDEVITGITLEDLDTPQFIYGDFSSQTIVTMVNTEVGRNFYCWAGDENDDPR